MSRDQPFPPKPPRIPGPVIFGILLMAVGGVVLLHNLGLVSLDSAWRLWPLLLILGGLVEMVNKGVLKVSAHVNLALGGVMLAGFNGFAPEAEKYWPLALVWVGLAMLARALAPRLAPPVPEVEMLPPADAPRVP